MDDLRGSAPLYTAKDVLVRLDATVTAMDAKLDAMDIEMSILASQKLNDRVTRLEEQGSAASKAALELAKLNAINIAKMQMRGAYIAGGIALLFVLFQIFAPLVQIFFHIPVSIGP